MSLEACNSSLLIPFITTVCPNRKPILVLRALKQSPKSVAALIRIRLTVRKKSADSSLGSYKLRSSGKQRASLKRLWFYNTNSGSFLLIFRNHISNSRMDYFVIDNFIHHSLPIIWHVFLGKGYACISRQVF